MSRSRADRQHQRRAALKHDEKRLENGRNRTHLRDALSRDPDSIPKRDNGAMRWDNWNWD